LGRYTFWCGHNMLVKDIHFAHTRTGSLNSGNFNSFRAEHCYFDMAGKVMAWGSPHAVVENCIFNLYERNAVETSAGVGKVEIRNCYIEYGNFATTAFLIDSGDSAVIENNIVVNSSRFLFMLADESLVRNNLVFYYQDPGLGGCNGCPVLVNNTFDNFHISNTNPGAAVDIWELGPFNFRNNSFSRMSSAIAFRHYEPWWWIPVKYSNLWQVDSLGMLAGYPVRWDTVEVLWQDPMYLDEYDYQLQVYSPLDVDGTRSDIGCYGGPGGCSYVYLDLAPLIPDSISATVDSSGIHIVWRANHEADFNRYQVFRDTVSGFPPSVFNMIAEPDTAFYLDTDILPNTPYYYRFTSVDNQGNISDPSEELAVIPTGFAWGNDGSLIPEYATIELAYPNPFNSNITIVYSASNLGPQPPQVKLVLYDILGREVKTLVDERKLAGTYRVTWDGLDDLGRAVSSGTYIARLYQWGSHSGDFPVKITLMR